MNVKQKAMLDLIWTMVVSAVERFPDLNVIPFVMVTEARGLHLLQPDDLPDGMRVRAVEWEDGTRNEVESISRNRITLKSPQT